MSQIFRWRKQLCEQLVPSTPAVIPVAVVPDTPVLAEAAPVRSRRRAGVIEIGLSGGWRVRVDRNVDAKAVRRVLDALDAR